jgi:ACS family sodium-dependent inorganic phosphate cotransporter
MYRKAQCSLKAKVSSETIESSTDVDTAESVDAELITNDNVMPQQENDIPSDYTKITMALLWGTAFLSALDRVAMSVAVLPLSQEFGYTDAIKGSISAFFSVGYGLAIVPAGIIVGTQSPRIMLGLGLAVWSLATMATPLSAATSASLVPLLATRAVVGAAESTILPSIQRLLSTWIPASQKGTALATIFTGFQCGTVAAYLISPFVLDEFGGWRGLFYLYGAIGILWLVPWLAFSRDAPPAAESIKLKQPEQELKQKSIGETFQEAMSGFTDAPWSDFAKSPAVWSMTLAHAANNWGLYNNLAWTPTFFAEQYGLNVKDSALLSILPSVAGAVGGLVAGSSADAILRNLDYDNREEMRTKVRKIYQGIALFGPALCLATLSLHIPEEPWVAQTLLTGVLGLQAFNAAGYQAANQEKAGDKWTGLLYSITSLPGVMVGSFAVYLTGQILDATGQDWTSVFALNALVNGVGAAAFVLFYNSKREFD